MQYFSRIGATSSESLADLSEALSDPDGDVRLAAARALGAAGPDAADAITALIGALDDSENDVRTAATRAIGEIGTDNEAAVDKLAALLNESDDALVLASVTALGRVGPPAAGAVPEILARDPTPFDIVFLDPPYGGDDLGAVCGLLAESRWLAPQALIYLESRESLENLALPPNWEILRRQKAGQVRYHLVAATGAT